MKTSLKFLFSLTLSLSLILTISCGKDDRVQTGELVNVGGGMKPVKSSFTDVTDSTYASKSKPAKKGYPPIGPLPKQEDINAAMSELGKYLFFDNRLSGDDAMSCSTCHDPGKGWADGLPLSKAYPGSLYFRNSKTILNTVHARYFYWDGRLTARDIPTLVRDSITETHFLNMDGRLMFLRLQQVPEYVEMFKKAFGGKEASFGRVLKAVAEFLKTVVSKNVPFDTGKLSVSAKKGQKLFVGKAGCIRCHNGTYFSDGKAHNLGVPENPNILEDKNRKGDERYWRHITMRSFVKFMGVNNFENIRKDPGHYVISKNEKDRGAFVTPTLRELTRTAPYMHNGMLKTLDNVIEFYNKGGGESRNKASMLKPLNLGGEEKKNLKAFLESLSGDEVIIMPPVDSKGKVKRFKYQVIKNWYKVPN